MSSLDVHDNGRGQMTAPDKSRDIGKDGSHVLVSPVDVVALREHSDQSRLRGADERNPRYRPSILVLSKYMTDRTKDLLRELLRGELARLELLTPLER